MSKQNKNNAAAPDLNGVPLKTRALPYAIVAPALLITIGIMIPFAMAIFFSLTNYTFRRPEYDIIWFENWIRVLTSEDFWHAAWVTLRYGFISTAVEMALGLGIALILNNLSNKFSKAMRVALIFPLMIAPITGTVIWQLMMSNTVGILEKFLNIFGVYNFPWAASPKFAMFTVIMIDVWLNTSFCMLLALAGLQSLPKSPFESAKIDGGSALFNFWNLTLPMLKPSLLIALLFRLMAALQEYAIISGLTAGGPGDTLMSLSLTAYQTGFRYSRFALALPYILVLWAFINFVAKNIVKWQRAAQRQASGEDE